MNQLTLGQVLVILTGVCNAVILLVGILKLTTRITTYIVRAEEVAKAGLTLVNRDIALMRQEGYDRQIMIAANFARIETQMGRMEGKIDNTEEAFARTSLDVARLEERVK